MTRRQVSVALDVTERSVMRWEDVDDTPLPPADKFLELVWLYGADLVIGAFAEGDVLVRQVHAFRRG